MIKVGVFFGGISREREISFAGGRTVYDNLNKSIFEAIPIFIDSLGELILLDWQYIYKGTIRDFYPPQEYQDDSNNDYQLYIENVLDLTERKHQSIINAVGKSIIYNELPKLIDFAFLCLHGEYGEDGALQGVLESLKIPYSGSGVRASGIGIDKSFQKKILAGTDFKTKPFEVLERRDWLSQTENKALLYENLVRKIGFPLVIRPSNQGSSIGVSIIYENNYEAFVEAINKAFFIKNLSKQEWLKLEKEDQVKLVKNIADLKQDVGLPSLVNGKMIMHPHDLLNVIEHFDGEHLEIVSCDEESEVIIEGFISGKEFSCIVMEDEDGSLIALPPTEIIKDDEVFDYRSKYLAGLSRKVTPIELPDATIRNIIKECVSLYRFLDFEVYARIDGFVEENGNIYLNDPNTTSGMLPSSFFFHQAAEIGLNPSQFITYIIHTSLIKRIQRGGNVWGIRKTLERLNDQLDLENKSNIEKTKIAVILGGYSSERHISVESGRNIFEKLSSSEKYEPIPIFLSGNAAEMRLHILPINLLLKDNADDINDKLNYINQHKIIDEIRTNANKITSKFSVEAYEYNAREISFQELKTLVDAVFIALHGRPGEDGQLQQQLDKWNLPFNGSKTHSAQITIDKYQTKKILRDNGFIVANDTLIRKEHWVSNKELVLKQVEEAFIYPLIAKPVDDGCSSAVKKIKNSVDLEAFLKALFRKEEFVGEKEAQILDLKPKEEFPKKEVALIEELISSNGAEKFLEVTGGMLAHYQDNEITFEVFEPSEALAVDAVLSLEEKFLAGQGQNITPARFDASPDRFKVISEKVRKDLEKAALLLGVEGYCRIDAFVRIYKDNRVETIIIEVNSLPGMTPATCIYHQAAINNYKPYEFIDKILSFGMEREKMRL